MPGDRNGILNVNVYLPIAVYGFSFFEVLLHLN